MRKPPQKLILMLDNPCEQLDADGLEVRSLAETIAGTALGNKGPFTIGVFGEWGQGKTSLLRLAHDYIKGDNEVVSTWFNAWQHEREKEPLFPLIASITAAIERKVNGKKKPINFEPFKKIGGSLLAVCGGIKASANVSVPHVGAVDVEVDGGKITDGVKEVFAPKQKEAVSDELRYLSAFQELSQVSEEAASNHGRGTEPKFVVFIDDLDRCDPESAVRLLESIKLILWQPGFVFVLALDERIITTYLKKQYVEKHGLDKDYSWGDFYLQKIVNLQLRVPRHSKRFEQYTKKQVAKLIKDYDEAPENPTSPALVALRAATGAIAVGAEQNPRAFVRLVNQFLVSCRLWSGVLDENGKEKPLTDEIAVAMAVDKTLTAKLGETLTQELADSQTMCEKVLESLGHRDVDTSEAEHAIEELENKLGIDNLPDGAQAMFANAPSQKDTRLQRDSEAESRPQTEETSLDRILRIINLPRNQALRDLISSDNGKIWFSDQTVRSEIRDFLAVYAEDTEVSFPPEIAERVRRELGLGANEPIPRSALTALTGLDYTNTHVTDAGINSLEKLTALKSLGLGHTSVTDAGLQSLEKLTELTGLDLGHTLVTDAGLQSLEKLTELTGLGLSNTQVTDAGLKSLEKLTALRYLYLDHTQVTDAGLKSLEKLTAITHLYLDNTQVTDAGLRSLESLTALESLYLSNTQVTDGGLKSLEKLTAITYLDLRSTKVTDAGVDALKKALPKCSISL